MNATDVLARHADYISGYARHCTCGEWSDVGPESQHTRLPFSAHQIDALKAAGFAVVELPQPDSTAEDGKYVAGWDISVPDELRIDCFGHIEDLDGRRYSAGEARDLAAALLAAADAAESS